MKSLLIKYKLAWLGLALLLSACASVPPPKQPTNVCSIFRQYPDWYWAASDVHRHWGLPINVLMAIIYQESHYQATVKTEQTHILWVIPWGHVTSAYGYSQALKGTWEKYREHENHTWLFTSRDDFSDAADFIGWYTYKIHREAHIPMNDTFHLYLAYHEGIRGYLRHSYMKKPWLIQVAKKVAAQAERYQLQLNQCQSSLPEHPWWHVW